MSKKDKRIKELEELSTSMAIECDEMEMTISGLRSSYIRLIGGMLRVRKERDELRHDLGECQSGWEAEKTMLVKQRMQWQETATKRRILLDGCYEKIESLESNLETAHSWKTYADSIESQIEILQTAIDERDERLNNIKFFLSDGDEG